MKMLRKRVQAEFRFLCTHDHDYDRVDGCMHMCLIFVTSHLTPFSPTSPPLSPTQSFRHGRSCCLEGKHAFARCLEQGPRGGGESAASGVCSD